MCGLAGFWDRAGRQADVSVVELMLNRQQLRGPDDRGVWAAGGIALGHDRLSILDLSSHGHQPFVTADGSSVIAYNGEVYNWRELRSELEAEGVVFTSDCDTEVVINALANWGPEKAIPRFNGMFAFAWFDISTDTLWLSRDRSGIKPLYLAERGSTLVFASEAKSLFAHPLLELRPDIHALVTQVYLERLAGDWTGFEGVRSVLPGTTHRISDSGTEVASWFDLERDVDVKRILDSRKKPFETHVAELRKRLEHSVELHLQSDAPLAVMCSGGLDSSLTTAIAKRHRSDLVAFVAEVEGAPVAEADKAQQVADHLGVALRRIRITDEEYPRLWCLAAKHNDDPMFFFQNPLVLKVSEAVRDEGFKVLVTGEGADELFGGYDWQAEAARMWTMRKWHARLIPNIAPLRFLGRHLPSFAPFDLNALMEEPMSRRTQLHEAPPAAELVIDAGMRRRRTRALFEKLEPISDLSERAFLTRAFDDFYHHLRVILTSHDKMTMANSVEMRVPFLENEIIDFALHLAPTFKFYKKSPKRIVKAVAENLLPSHIVHAKKIGFSMPNTFWKGYESLLEGGLVPQFFKWAAPERERIQEVLQANPFTAQKLVGMELWAQIHFNGKTPEQMEEKLRSVRKGGVRSRVEASAGL